jgi:hypothetical protein
MHQVVMNSLQLFGIKKPTSQGMAKPMRWEVGVIKLTAKPASVLANKPQLREYNRQLPDPLWDKGHYRTGFRRL